MPESFRDAGLLLRVRSKILGEVVWFASDNAHRPKHVPRTRIYYASELERLIELQPDAEGLRRIHETKVAFAGKVE